jgi:hypothetical protein
MKRRLAGTLLVLVAVSVGSAVGQVAFTASLFNSSLNLAKSPEIQKELRFTEEQTKKLADLDRKLNEMLKVPGFPDAALQAKIRETLQKGFEEILLPEQTKRLKQLEIQQRGSGALLDATITKDLQINAEQRAEMLKQLQQFGQRWAKAGQGAKTQQEIQKRLGEVQREMAADMVKLLTPEQQAKWREITGAPYTGAFPTQIFVGVPRPQPVLTWHMNNLDAALTESKATGRPIFVTFRCES